MSRIKEAFRSILPTSLWTLLRLARLRWTVAVYRRKLVSHVYCGYPLQLSIEDPLAEGWYDHDWPVLPEIELLRRGRLKPGKRVFNLGMHQGVIALVLARIVAPDGPVIALEASAFNAKVAAANRGLNDAVNLVPLHAAAARASGTISINQGLNAQVDDGGGEWGRGMVEALSVDDLSSRYGLPDVLYIDIEGYECEALGGAAATLASHPDCFIEVHVGMGLEKFGGSVEEVLRNFPSDRYDRFIAPAGPAHAVFIPWTPESRITLERFHLIALAKSL